MRLLIIVLMSLFACRPYGFPCSGEIGQVLLYPTPISWVSYPFNIDIQSMITVQPISAMTMNNGELCNCRALPDYRSICLIYGSLITPSSNWSEACALY
jgi:hypothetical protein